MLSSTSRWRDVTPYLLFCAFFFAWGDMLFGLDAGSFGSIQSLPSFLSDFGDLTAKGTYILPTTRKAIMNSSTPALMINPPPLWPLADVDVCSCLAWQTSGHNVL